MADKPQRRTGQQSDHNGDVSGGGGETDWGSMVDPSTYAALNVGRVPRDGIDPAAHFAFHGRKQGCLPNSVLSPSFMARSSGVSAQAARGDQVLAYLDAALHRRPRVLILLQDFEDRPMGRQLLAWLDQLVASRSRVEPVVIGRRNGALRGALRALAHAHALAPRFGSAKGEDLDTVWRLLSDNPPALVLHEGPCERVPNGTRAAALPDPPARGEASHGLVLGGAGPLTLTDGVEQFGLFARALVEALPQEAPKPRFLWAGDGPLWPNQPLFYARHQLRLAGAEAQFTQVPAIDVARVEAACDLWFRAQPHPGRPGWQLELTVAEDSAAGRAALRVWDGTQVCAENPVALVDRVLALLDGLPPSASPLPPATDRLPDAAWLAAQPLLGAILNGEGLDHG